MSTTRTAIVVGGGVAGPVAAMALQRAGIEATIYESHAPTADEAGSYLTVAANGLDALRAIDAEHTVLDHGFPTATTILLSGSGKRLGAVTNGGRLADGTPAHTIKRSRLWAGLRDEATARGIEIAYGRRFSDAEDTGDGITATFADGTQASADLLIGADGVHSTTRRLLDAHAPQGRYIGLVNFGGYTPRSAEGAEPNAWYMIFGARAFFGYALDAAGGTVWFANVPRPAVTAEERAAKTAQDWRRELADLFAHDRGPARRLIDDGELELIADNTHDLPSVPTWRRGSMVVIGDAAHAPSPSSGQGASMAAEDAVVLAQCLRDVPGTVAALETYEALRRARVQRIVKQGARTSSAKAAGPIGRVFRDALTPFFLKVFASERAMAWIHGHHIEWDAGRALSGGRAA